MFMTHKAHAPATHPLSATNASSRIRDLFYHASDAWLAQRKAQSDRREIARAEAELYGLDDLLLADMGISRSTIHAAVTGKL